MALSRALDSIQRDARIFIHGGAATPRVLLEGVLERSRDLGKLTLIHLHTEGASPEASPQYREHVRVINLFVGANLRKHLDYDRIDYLPVFLSEIPALFRSGKFDIDVAIVHVSPPDRFGYCSLGVSVDVAKAAVRSAKKVIAQVNPRMPRVFGDGMIHESLFAAQVLVDEPLPECAPPAVSEEEKKLAHFVSELIDNGSTLQMGIGSIPNCVATYLSDRKDLGIHTEMWSDGVLALLQKGIVTNSKKHVHAGKTVSSFVMGSQRLYDFINDNPSVLQLEADYVNNPRTISRNPKVVAINSAVEIDLTGQVCADSVGAQIISGVGGQMDFMRGAALSEGGKPIVALTSLTKKGASKIVASLKPGAGVVTTRAHVQYVVTEHGIADLRGKTIGERAKALIGLADPQHREGLEREFFDLHRR